MSFDISTVPHTVLAEAFAQARVEFGVGSESDFRIVRTSAKGKKSVRSELGLIMSGNKAERTAHANHKALEMWVKSKVALIAAELLRVFPKLESAIKARNAGVNGVIEDNPELADKLRLINLEKPGKLDLMAMFKLASDQAGADKSEKAKLLAAGHVINSYELRVQEIAQEMMAAIENATA